MATTTARWSTSSLSTYGTLTSFADLARAFRFQHRLIEVYPSEFFIFGLNKPKPGHCLNQPALLKFKNFFKEGPRAITSAARQAIERECKAKRAELVGYDERCNTLILKVNFF